MARLVNSHTRCRALGWRLLWIFVLLAVAAAGGWVTLGFAAVLVAVALVIGTCVVLAFRFFLRRSVLTRSWAWTWFEKLTAAVHDDPSGRQVQSLLNTLHESTRARRMEVVRLTFLAFVVQLQKRMAATSRTVDPQELVSDVRRRAVATLGPHDDDPDFANDADIILLRDLHTPAADLDADQDERLANFIPLFAAVMCEDPARDLDPLRSEVTKAVWAQQRSKPRTGSTTGASR